MKILVLNCGSSSVKYQLIEIESKESLAKGIIERIGKTDAIFKQQTKHANIEKVLPIKNHEDAIKLVIDTLINKNSGVISEAREIAGIGHRVVHGGEELTESVLISDAVIEKIEKYCRLAPLHNPHNLTGIKAARHLLGFIPQVAVFDTAFHSSLPEYAYLYAIPYSFYEKHSIRRYGFHGTSHKYVAHRAAEILGKKIEQLRIITCHLGNGSSITAVYKGKAIDTSMGFTPLEGLVMGTRCGDIDPAIVLFLISDVGLSIEEVNDLLNKKSGLLGISGISNDMREILKAKEHGNQKANLAIEIYCYRVKKYIGAYTAVMGGLDTLVFTAGIGENSPTIREKCCANLEFLGLEIDKEKNSSLRGEGEISTFGSKVKVLVIPTNEELLIALETAELIKKINNNLKIN